LAVVKREVIHIRLCAVYPALHTAWHIRRRGRQICCKLFYSRSYI